MMLYIIAIAMMMCIIEMKLSSTKKDDKNKLIATKINKKKMLKIRKKKD
jgi:hypothetical protein